MNIYGHTVNIGDKLWGVAEPQWLQATWTGIQEGTGGPVAQPLILEIDSNKGGVTNNDQFAFPTVAGYDYDATVDWGDGVVEVITGYDNPLWTHTFSGGVGIYDVEVDGTFEAIRFNSANDRMKVSKIKQ